MRRYEEYAIKTVSTDETVYPQGIACGNKKMQLYYKGNVSIINEYRNIAVIGTRKMSREGEKLSYITGQKLAEVGINVINGLALGCDTSAIKGALSKRGKCVAVMPCSLEQVYPHSNYRLAEQILDMGGCLISEYPVGTILKKYHYVERDKIQSEISQAVIVIEADEKSGTMHTANFALKQYKRLACYYDKLFQSATGNRVLLETGKADTLKMSDDVKKFIDSLDERTDYCQMTFQEFL